MNTKLFATLLLTIFLLDASNALPRISIKGQRMFDGEKQFFCRGVAYAPSENSATADPLSDFDAISRDIPVFKQMNVNCIRIYQYLVTSNVQRSLQALDDAGIYVILDLYDPSDNINREDPSWTTDFYEIMKQKIALVANAPNLLGFIAGNEVTNNVQTTPASAFVKAAIRDVKLYLKSINRSYIPVGYAGADDANIIDNMQDFFACGDNSTHVDFYGINVYRWCSNTATFSETYLPVRDKYVDYPVPTILTEFGCIVQGDTRYTREWNDVPVIFGTDMNGQFSGGIAYEYHTAASSVRPEGDYGMTEYNADETVATLKTEGVSLGAKYGAVVNQAGQSTKSAYNPTPRAVTCPAASANWMVSPDQLPPTPDTARCACLDSQFNCRTKVRKMSDVTAAYGTKLGGVIGTICGNNPAWCKAIETDTATAEYGRFSMCDSLVKGSLLMNYVYQDTGRCEFGQDADFQEFIENPASDASCTAYGDSVSIADFKSEDETQREVTLPSSELSSWSTSTFSSISTKPRTSSGVTETPTSGQDNNGNTQNTGVQTLNPSGQSGQSGSAILIPSLFVCLLLAFFM
eukprot:TRINITY_DN652_c0_g1_i4.p1 TRINITY_DN652_c0_g1~~TRINITY_DN652_c0_g1_i4.p1  ORF type:complete len:611 (+),score=170.32 TRINITY_DN652_c0_g1_i4:105-1835(+)